MYKSTDAGKTWTHLGLRDGQQIPRIIIDPRNPNRLFVAVLGHPYGPNAERGVFRSLNGGTSFERVLYTDENTGAADLAFAPNNPNIVYAVMWESRQAPWENGRFQGPGSAIYKTTDGGNTWKKLTKGLPVFADDGLGRIGIAVAPSNPNRLYATVESAKAGGVYTSTDAGENWVRVTSDNRFYGRAEDFAAITVDSKDENTVYTPNVVTWKSVDGGKTWNAFRGAPGGDDYQRIWINPADNKVMLLIGDQGAIVTVNGGETWSSWYNQPTAQFYHVTADNAFPYRLCGGQQESGSACVSSRGDDGSIGYREWHPVGIEEYAYAAPDPLNPDIVYGGRVQRFNRVTGQTQNVGPYVGNGTTLTGASEYRVIRTMPILFSPTNPKKLYFASNVVWETVNGGQAWKQISPDLSRETWEVPRNVGKHVGTPAAAPSRRGVVYALAPSPVDSNTIWAGTDDGLIHVTRTNGKTWTNVSPQRLTPWMKVSVMDASHFDANTAYAAINTLRLDDLRPHILRTRDGGKTWTEIVSGIDSGATINAVREDPKRRGLLFAGSERGVWYSLDDGDHWHSLRLNLPASSVRDLIIKDNDLAVATHGRGFWILDDISPLRQWSSRVLTDSVTLIKPAQATRVRYSMYTDTPVPPDEPMAENPPDGAVIDYYMPRDARAVTLEILTAQGRVIRKYTSSDPVVAPHDEGNWPWYWFRPPQVLSTKAGFNRFVWDLHYDNPPVADFELPISATPHNTVREPRGPWVQPGTYTVKLTVNDRAYTQAVDVRMDPRVKTPVASLLVQYNTSVNLIDAMNEAEVRSATARAFVDTLSARKAKATGDLAAAIDAYAAKFIMIAAVHPAAGRAGAPAPDTFGAITGSLLPLLSALQESDEVPTSQTIRAVDERMRAMAALRAQWTSMTGAELTAINAKLAAAGQPPLKVIDVRTGTGYSGGGQ
ncbi:MAG TPA: hypothetical protein VE967_16625, partial [Gemmatimonadaceae bacterium]|nr:hypothetical protein [Gemmatimonadaceae bacterium]